MCNSRMNETAYNFKTRVIITRYIFNVTLNGNAASSVKL